MTDLEDDLQRLLATRAGQVDPQLTGSGIRALAASRRGQRLRTLGLPAAGTVLAAALLVTPFVLIRTHDSPQRPGQVVVPAGTGTPSPTAPDRVPASSPASRPPLTVPSRPPVLSPTASPSATMVPRPSSTGVTAPPARPTALPSGSESSSTSARPTPTR